MTSGVFIAVGALVTLVVYAVWRARSRRTWAERTKDYPERAASAMRYQAGNRVRIAVLAVGGYVLGVVLLAAGGWLLYETQYRLPHVYSTLGDRGVRVSAVAELRHKSSGRFGNDHYYLLRYEYPRRQDHELKVFDNLYQFDGQRLDAVAVLVDPRHPGTAMTVADVRNRTGTGVNFYSIAGVLSILGALVWLRGEFRLTRPFEPENKHPDWFDERLPRPPLKSLEAVEEVVRGGERLPLTSEVKVNYSAARTAIAHLRTDLGSAGGPTPGLPELDRLENLLQAGNAGPLVDTASVDEQEATDLLAGMRLVLARQSEITKGLG
jgi:hypothetical protein